MSIQYENTIIGVLKIGMLFSPLKSIEGASEIMKLTKMFPVCHYETIRSYSVSQNMITLVIALEYCQKIMKICFFDVMENKLTNHQETNTIFQLTFSYCKEGIEVVIDSIEGLEGTIICKRITSEFMIKYP